MAQYIPCTNLENYQEINRNITKREYNKVVDYALSKGLKSSFVQELSSADDNTSRCLISAGYMIQYIKMGKNLKGCFI